jgi:branched-chain amino acid transport system permease protein
LLIFPILITKLPRGDYILHTAILALIYVLLAQGLNIVCGFTGLLDLGYVGFYAIGAYTAGLLATDKLNLSFWLILPMAAANAILMALLRGAPTLRLTGDYFAIVTFGFSELIVYIIRNEQWLTRGPRGLPGILPPSIFGREFSAEWQFYYLILVIVSISILVKYRLQDSRLGRAWKAIREDELAAAASGINLKWYKATAFAISAAFGGIGGAFFARWQSFISPDNFQFWESILVLCMIVLGGMGSIVGSALGAVVMISLSEILRSLLPSRFVDARFLIFGAILVLMMRFRPEGLVGERKAG